MEIIEIETEDSYKYKQILDNGDIILRNNNDPTLTPDGLLTVEKQLEKIQEEEEKQNFLSREDIDRKIRIKCIILYKMGRHILENLRNLKQRDIAKYYEIKDAYAEYITEEQLIKDFNEACQNTIFDLDADYSKFPVYI